MYVYIMKSECVKRVLPVYMCLKNKKLLYIYMSETIQSAQCVPST